MSRVLAFALLPLLFAACALDDVDPETSQFESDLSAAQWQAPVAIDQTALRAPSVAYWNNHLTMATVHESYVYRHSFDLTLQTLDGSTWSRPTLTTLQPTDGVSIAVLAGQLYLAEPNTYGIAIYRYVPASGNWDFVVSKQAYEDRPTLAVMGSNLYLAYGEHYTDGTTERERMVLERVDGASLTRLWSHTLPQGIWMAGIALASWSGQIHLVWSDGPAWSTPTPMHELTAVPGSVYVVNDLGMNSDGVISMTVCNGTMHLVHAGDADASQTWWSYRSATTTGTWSPNVRLSQAGSAAVVGCNVFVQPTMIQSIGLASDYSSKLAMSIFQ